MTLRGLAEHFSASIETGIVGMGAIPMTDGVLVRPACDPDRSTTIIQRG
jgi:hypothetical protein